ncbi:interferon alpha/beta receptor 1a-like [Anguilla rostrata]|uniref:interferon alpha/beta receptor 1a-like n=1 Tax=Anguilla rostrata TaxID=7938 RepID=UPI0030D12E7F
MNMVAEFVLVVLSFLQSASEVSAILPSPHNLSLQTLNTQYILKWEWEQQTPANQSVTFTAQYLPRNIQDWTLVCNATLDMQCDFSHSQMHYNGIYVLRVRADSAGESSEWVQTTEFWPDRDGDLGPPSKVEVVPGNGLLRVWISDPLTSNNKSMRELSPSLYFFIQYWKQTKNVVEGSRVLRTSKNEVTLLNLQSWTTYCVRVRSHFDYYNKTSHFSPALCMKTTGQVPAWLVILALCLVLAALFFGLYRSLPLIKSTFFPSAQLPVSMYPCDSSGPDWAHLLAAETPVEVFCEKLEVCPKEMPPETQALPDPPRHSHQGSHVRVYLIEGQPAEGIWQMDRHGQMGVSHRQ